MSLHSAVTESAKKMKKGVRSLEVEHTHDKDGKEDGYLVTHHMHDYEHPKNGMKVALSSHHVVAKHIKEVMPLAGEAELMGPKEKGYHGKGGENGEED